MSDKKNLDSIRKNIDRLDQTIVKALGERQRIVKQVISDKLQTSKEIRDPDREEALLNRIRALSKENGMDPFFMEQLFREIIHHSVRYQTHALVDKQNDKSEETKISVAFQGTDGAFSHMAALRHFEHRYDQVNCIGYTTFRQAAEAVEKKEVDVALLPIENTTAGSINDTYDLLGEKNLFITGEEVLRIVHCLMAPEPIQIENVRRILSHPQAIAQCSKFLYTLPRCHVESYFDTAMAARKVRDDADLSQAAIASSYAAELYGLHIIKRDIVNQEENFTRFVEVARDELICDPQIPGKTSLMFTTSHDKGALLKCLNVIGDHGINMAKIESRPRPNHPWQYLFYLDIEGNLQQPAVDAAVKKLRSKAQNLKVFGSYPAKQGEW